MAESNVESENTADGASTSLSAEEAEPTASGPGHRPGLVSAADAGKRKPPLSTYLPILGVIAVSVAVWIAARWAFGRHEQAGLWSVAAFAALAGAVVSVAVRPMMASLCALVQIPVTPTSRPIVPAVATAGLWFGAVMIAGGDAILPAWLTVAALSVWAAWIDHFTLRFPLPLIRAVTAAGLLLGSMAVVIDQDPAAGLRAVVAGAAIFASYLVFAIITRGHPGLADVRLSFILTAAVGWVGWMNVASAVLLPNILAVIGVAVTKVFGGRKIRGVEFGFAPYLVVGTALAIALPAGWWML
ncbi:hypothetical protein [Rhodococcus erythropolis]|uniref:hypothetical protein n=1 Tax=Rhodococcus erythropolis TaxID=1833 RepID=UPI0021BF919E|nr:hypothetical protein [Rhodococcus erythropolis]